MHTYRDDLLYQAVKTSPKTGWDYDFVVRASFGVFTGEGIQKKNGNTQRKNMYNIPWKSGTSSFGVLGIALN